MSASGGVPNGCRARVDSTRPGRSAGGFGLRQSCLVMFSTAVRAHLPSKTTMRTIPVTGAVPLLFALLATSSGAGRAQTGEIITDPDAYAVYAAVISERIRTEGKPVRELALLQETRAGMDCVGPEREKRVQPEWRPVVASFRKQNARVQIIRSGLNLGVPYSLVTVDGLRKLMRDAGYSKKSPHSNAFGSDVFARFPGGQLVAFSAVGFNAERTRAMVAMQNNCVPSWDAGTRSGDVCHDGEHTALEKKGGRWNILHYVSVGCHWNA
jgi:hypothetical protein